MDWAGRNWIGGFTEYFTLNQEGYKILWKQSQIIASIAQIERIRNYFML